MQGIYTYIPETNYVPREYSVAAILLLLFVVLISLVSVLNLLYFYISTFRSMCAMPNMAVFWSSLTSCFPGMLLTYFLNDFEIVPVAPIITGITFVFTFDMRCISIVSSLYFRIFSASFLITFLSLEILTSINIHVPFSLSQIIMFIIIIIICHPYTGYLQWYTWNKPIHREQKFAAILWLQFMVYVRLFPTKKICTFTLVLSEVQHVCSN